MPIKDISLRLDLDTWEELHEAAHRRRTSKQQALLAGLRMWLGGSEAAGSQTACPAAQAHAEALAKIKKLAEAALAE